jgi:hypothetical protein
LSAIVYCGAENSLRALAKQTKWRSDISKRRITVKGQINGKKVNDMTAAGSLFPLAQL